MISDSHNHNQHNNHAEKMQKCQEYIEALQEEHRKIQVFQRELPLCLELVAQAIETCKQQLSGTSTECFHGQSECSEQISTEGPVLEEFIPIKKNSSCDYEDNNDDDDDDDDDDNEQQSLKSKINNNDDRRSIDKLSKKSDWLRSVQLWNHTPDPPTKQESPRKVSIMEVKRNGGGAFHPFKKENNVGTIPTKDPSVPAAAASSTAENGGGGGGGGGAGGASGGGKKEEKEGQSQRKARRCWSPELHRRFLHALQQLGGSHVATPKQIRELMKVDGLTNDEVKSHLQKYRLHSRRSPTPSIHNNNNQQAPQFVVVGGIWVPPPEYAAAVETAAASKEASGVSSPSRIYAPIAAPPPPPQKQQQQQQQQQKQSKQLHSDGRASHSEGRGHSSSPASSSSTHTTTASLAL
ncbi:Transcription factor HHO3 [Camellia lanceoleosa]|uniref:Transcription factor HHO3 n=1 Tax=Camellia lanceoleosa TaxID=1840588 RepID=A0ACC0G833_9ERIC|nr:Transcription factor HHO3 [Camellia lanceoleosa]